MTIKTFEPQVNPSASLSNTQRFVDFSKTSLGALRFTQELQKGARVVNETFKLTSVGSVGALSTLDSALGATVAGLAIPKIPSSLADAVKSVKALKEPSPIPGSYRQKIYAAFHDVSDLIEMTSHAGTLVASAIPGAKAVTNAFKTSAAISGFAADGVDVPVYAERYAKNQAIKKDLIKDTTLAPTSKARMVENLKHSNNFNLMKLAKGVMSAFTGAIALVVMALGFPFIPSIVLAVIGLATVTLAIVSYLYEKSRPDTIVDPYKTQFVDLTAAVAI